MIEVIKHGNYIKQMKCNECGCEYNYNIAKDVLTEYYNPYTYATEHIKAYNYVKCPECGNKNKIWQFYD